MKVRANLSNTEVTFNYFHFLNKEKKRKKGGEYRSYAKKEKVQNYFLKCQWLPGTSTIQDIQDTKAAIW